VTNSSTRNIFFISSNGIITLRLIKFSRIGSGIWFPGNSSLESLPYSRSNRIFRELLNFIRTNCFIVSVCILLDFWTRRVNRDSDSRFTSSFPYSTFNNISIISGRSVLLVEETGVLGENHRPVTSHWQIVSHNVVSRTPRLNGIRTHNVSGDRHWLLKKLYIHMITTTTAPANSSYSVQGI
jgi:hypothetical protein